METFAPAYFDYMSSAIHANVSASFGFLSLSLSLSLIIGHLAPFLTCKGFWLLQVDFQENRQRQGTGQIEVDTNEFTCNGELVLRQTFQQGMECSCSVTT